MGQLRDKPIPVEEQFTAVNDERLRLSLVGLTDRYNEAVRDLIYRTYQDNELAALYRAIRASGQYQHGGRSKVHRKIIEFPNVYVFDFVNTVLYTLYGKEWMKNPKALRHELVRPWWVVERL